MKHFSHLNTAARIVELYKGEQPFSHFLRDFFSRDKKYGSRDRKQVSRLCYGFFRLGKAGSGLAIPEKLLVAYFLCGEQPDDFLQQIKPEWNEAVHLSLREKLSLLPMPFSPEDVFPWKNVLSDNIEYDKFCQSFFIQPDLFLRFRPGKEKTGIEKLTRGGISFQQPAPDCVALPNGTKIETILQLNKEAVVQDYSSQRVGGILAHSILKTAGQKLSVWDCCAASGGKSILAKDILGEIDLTVSDIRESILVNLKKRFSEAGITNYKSFLADLDSKLTGHDSRYDLIIADVPCTGSGTWGRTPEQLYYFEKEKIESYARKQENIISNTVPSLKPGGHLLYITCSVFRKENENNIDFIREKFSFELIQMNVLKGYDNKADTLFAALLQKPL